MKLNIGENIRRLRRNADITQEELAERMGVSYQSVSRWETGTTYPDMELLPSLAELFSVTVDELLGMSDEKKEQLADAAFDELTRATRADPLDENHVIECLRDIRRNHLKSKKNWRLWLGVNSSVYRRPAILDELRRTVDAMAQAYPNVKSYVDAVYWFAQIEDDDHIDEFFQKYATHCDLRFHHLRHERALSRGEWDKAEEERLIKLYWTMCELLTGGVWATGILPDVSRRLDLLRLKFDLLHRFNGHTPDETHPISGNGKVDLWAETRIDMGIRYAAHLAYFGENEKAFVVLEDVVSLLEKAMSVEGTVEMGCDSPWLAGFTYTTKVEWNSPDILATEHERCLAMYSRTEGGCAMLYPSYYRKMMAELPGCEMFDSIRKDERFGVLLGRIERLHITRKA